MNQESDIELIETYLQGDLTEQERLEFENRLSIDDDFRVLFEEELLIKDVIEDKKAQDFLTSINEVLEEAKVPSKTINLRKYTWAGIGIAASVLVLFMLNLYNPGTTSSEELYQKYYKTYPMVLSQRGDNQAMLDELVSAYNNDDWNQTADIIPNIPSDILPDPLKDLYLAIGLLELNKAQESIELLSKYIAKPTSELYQNDLEWYLALSYIAGGNQTSAKGILKKLKAKVSSSSKLGIQVDELLQQL